MEIRSVSEILAAKLQGDRSYVLVFVASSNTFELFLPGAGYPGEFAGYMTPSVRNQQTGESWELGWAQAELLAAHLQPLVAVAGGASAMARRVVDALVNGRRYGIEV